MSNNNNNNNNNAETTSEKPIAIGMDVGSWNARLASYDESLQHAVMIANHDGHRTTRVELEEHYNGDMETFVRENLLALAASSAHTKNLTIMLSVPSDDQKKDDDSHKKILQKFGSVITDAAAICLAYEDSLGNYSTTLEHGSKILVLDGGARGIKATLLECQGNNNKNNNNSASGGGEEGKNELPMLAATSPSKMLSEVNGNALIDALGQTVAQQFEQKNRFPRGEVWESKKAKAKLRRACESGLKTLVINNTVTIHVDGLYEGVDCQVTISKPKWDHLSSKMATKAKTFLKGLAHEPDVVLLAGNMHPWLKPHVKAVFPSKLVTATSFDPSEAVALGCAKQAYLNMMAAAAASDDGTTTTTTSSKEPTTEVSVSPVSIGIKSIVRKEEEEGKESAEDGDESLSSLTMIPKGTPLPALVTKDFVGAVSMDLWQLQPQEKQLASFAELDEVTTLKLHLNEQGKLKIWLNNETLTI